MVLFKRTAAGAWSQHIIEFDHQTSNDDRKRPVVSILDSDIYVFSIDQNRLESSYQKATLASLAFGGRVPVFKVGSLETGTIEFVRNNIVPRGPTTTATGLPIMIDNLSDLNIWQTMLPANSGNQPPGVYAGEDQIVTVAPPTDLLGQVDDDLIGAPVTSLWTMVSGPGIVTFGNSAAPLTTASFSIIGTYLLRLTATEAGVDPLSNFDEVQVTVQNLPNQPPILTVLGPSSGSSYEVGELVELEGSAIDPESGDISADIVWVSSRDGQVGVGGYIPTTALTIGTHTITATVSDGQNIVVAPGIIVTITEVGGGEPVDTFTDDDGSIFEADIEWLVEQGITSGCNSEGTLFCPNNPVTRAQMATFLVNALGYPPVAGNRFTDVSGTHLANINALAEAGVTVGICCNASTRRHRPCWHHSWLQRRGNALLPGRCGIQTADGFIPGECAESARGPR